MAVRYTASKGVVIITIDRPPVNSLDLETRRGIVAALTKAQSDQGVIGIVLTGSIDVFSAGADIREFESGLAGQAFAAPSLGEVIDQVAGCAKPIVAVINGVCLGGGFELALGCHLRIVGPKASFGLPEVKLGLMPGAGGTQRLPRLIGAGAALDLILSGNPVDADQAVRLGIAQPANGDAMTAAVTLAADAGLVGRSHAAAAKLAGSNLGMAPSDYIRARRAELRRALPASLRCLDAVELSMTVALDEGLRRELSMFRELMETAESRALRYDFFGDRVAGQIRDMAPGAVARPLERIAVIGSGTMGIGIALCAVNAEIPVALIDASEEALRRARASIGKIFEGAERKGRQTAEESSRRMALIETGTDMGAVASADLVIEAAFESLDVKREIFKTLGKCAKPSAILASNTSTLDLNLIAGATNRPEDVVGLHFFSPAQVMRLLEVVRGARTADDVLVSAMAFAKRIRKVAVVAGVCDGFIGNRLFEEYVRQAGFLLDEGALPAQVDRALENWGMAMGPFAVIDLAGGDIARAIRQRRAIEQPDRPYSTLPDKVHSLGKYGQKTGSGYYLYTTGSRARATDPEIEALVVAHSKELGIQRRVISDEEIVSRCILALVNEGAQALEEGIAQRASDIDVVYRHGYGFPPERGGPMFYADELGLSASLTIMGGFEAGYQGAFWKPAARLRALADAGRRLTDT